MNLRLPKPWSLERPPFRAGVATPRMKNKHDLSRDIPETIKREVRQRCGFGCIFCGCPIVDYHHFDPPFTEGVLHDPDRLTLLCVKCHRGLHSRQIDQREFRRALASPCCLKQGWVGLSIRHTYEDTVIHIGRSTWKRTPVLIRAYEKPVLCIEPPDEGGHYWLLSGHITDSGGKTLLRIDRNEWQTPTEHWDIKIKGSRLEIRNASRSLGLVLDYPAENTIAFYGIDWLIGGIPLQCPKNGDLVFGSAEGPSMQFEALEGEDCRQALIVDDNGLRVGEGCGTIRASGMVLRGGY